MRIIRVASRTSALAMTQTRWVIDQLEGLHEGFSYEIVPIVTRGDKILDVPLAQVGGKGLFVTEIEQTLLNEEADFAVHSLKDVPAQLAEGLVLAGIPLREDPRDALISRHGSSLADLPSGAVIGTSSLRRLAQLRAVRPDLVVKTLRGNIDTRLRKLIEGEYDAVILAAAGLHRMGWRDRISEYLDPNICLPALGQGILGIECRAEDESLKAVLGRLTDLQTSLAAQTERTLLDALNGSCQIPMAGWTQVRDDGSLYLQGLVASPDGETILRAESVGTNPETVALDVASQLRNLGAEAILGMITVSGT